MFDALTHITIATGHSAVTARSDVAGEVLMRLQPVIDAESGSIPLAGVYLDFVRPLDPVTHKPRGGAAAWSILGGLKPPAPLLAQCVVCWDEDVAAECWEMVLHMQRATGMEPSPRAKRPETLPWLAVVIAPGMASASHETVSMLGDMERCLAWVLIETPL